MDRILSLPDQDIEEMLVYVPTVEELLAVSVPTSASDEEFTAMMAINQAGVDFMEEVDELEVYQDKLEFYGEPFFDELKLTPDDWVSRAAFVLTTLLNQRI